MTATFGSRATRALLSLCALALVTPHARAQEPQDGASFCKTPLTRASLFASDASEDLYNSILWFAGSGAIRLGSDTGSRWSAQNDFDEGIRDGLRENSASARESAALASDITLGLSVAMPVAAIGRTLYERDCEAAYDMTTDLMESVSLALFATEAAKAIAGRERPFVRSCNAGTAPTDADCSGKAQFKSFFSGHASIAAAGAGVSCAFAIRRRTWGDSLAPRAVPCVLGVGGGLATGVLRLVSDSHWGSDVIVGLGVGVLVGYLDTWGPFDLLHFEMEPQGSARKVEGMLLPYAGAGEIGARIDLRF